MAPQDITVTQDGTYTGGLCLVAIEPVSHYILLEQPAAARDHDPWSEPMAHALAPLKGNVVQSTSDEATGLLAYVDHPLGTPHSPDLFHVQHELSKAVAAPMAVKQRAAAKAIATAGAMLKEVQEHQQDAIHTCPSVWYHIEHALLQTQAIMGYNLFGSPVPVRILQVGIRRVELHLSYNTIVFIPMVLAMYFLIFPPKNEEPNYGCSCAWHRGQSGPIPHFFNQKPDVLKFVLSNPPNWVTYGDLRV